MIYELKQKIRHSKWGENFAKRLEKTPLFPACYRALWAVGLTEPQPDINETIREAGKKFFETNQDKVKKILSLLADEKSKEVFLSCIKFRSSHVAIADGTPHDQYFPKDIIHLSGEEVFVDCGAYTGDTIAQFRKVSKDRYNKIVAFEPDADCRQQILNQKNPRCEVLPYGAWNQKDTQVFLADGKGHSFVESVAKEERDLGPLLKKTTISLEKIDNLEACASVTFLKMDIEGAEQNALKGAEKTIRHQRPKMAICIYHSNQDMLEIPLWVASLNMGYKLYIRHHSMGLCETVLYAI